MVVALFEACLRARSDQRFRRVADEPPQHHSNRDPRLQLDGQMGEERAREHDGPRAKARHHQHAHEDGVRRPERGDRLFGRCEDKPDLRAEIIGDEDREGGGECREAPLRADCAGALVCCHDVAVLDRCRAVIPSRGGPR